MPLFLRMRLCGAMQSWGGHTYETKRPSGQVPSRSGLTGLLAACLGIDRSETDRIISLDRSYSFAVRSDEFKRTADGSLRKLGTGNGSVLTDFHTVQNVRLIGKKTSSKTEVTHREYLVDRCFTVFLKLREGASHPYPLRVLGEALVHPVFTPYLGRKCCPLNEPPFGGLVQADSFDSCFLADQEEIGGLIYSEEPPVRSSDFLTSRERDVLLSASEHNRRFGTREICIYSLR